MVGVMLAVRRPHPDYVEAYRTARARDEPTCDPAASTPNGFARDVFIRGVGVGDSAFDRAREGVRQWVAHRAAGVEVSPPDAPIVAGETVALVTRQLGAWVLAACRLVEVVDEPDRFGFTYATLPGHPECGWESFVVARVEAEVRFTIEAVSKPAATIVRLGPPIARQLQKRATIRYLDGMDRWTRDRI